MRLTYNCDGGTYSESGLSQRAVNGRVTLLSEILDDIPVARLAFGSVTIHVEDETPLEVIIRTLQLKAWVKP